MENKKTDEWFIVELNRLQRENRMDEFDIVANEYREWFFSRHPPDKARELRQFQWKVVDPILRKIPKNPVYFQMELRDLMIDSALKMGEKIRELLGKNKIYLIQS